MTGDEHAARVAEIRAREQAATPGPWFVGTSHEHCGEVWIHTENPPPVDTLIPPYRAEDAGPGWDEDRWRAYYRENIDPSLIVTGWDDSPENAAFVAHSRADIPYLLDRLDAVTAERDHVVMQRDAARFAIDQIASERIAMLEVVQRLQRDQGVLTAELAAERARNAPLRARVKEVQDRADQIASPLLRQIERHKGCDEVWSRTNQENYRRWKEAEAERDQARQALAHRCAVNRLDRACEDCQNAMAILDAMPIQTHTTDMTIVLAGHQQAAPGDGAEVMP